MSFIGCKSTVTSSTSIIVRAYKSDCDNDDTCNSVKVTRRTRTLNMITMMMKMMIMNASDNDDNDDKYGDADNDDEIRQEHEGWR